MAIVQTSFMRFFASTSGTDQPSIASISVNTAFWFSISGVLCVVAGGHAPVFLERCYLSNRHIF